MSSLPVIKDIFLKTSNPNCGCVLIIVYSSSVREDLFFKISSGIPIFPFSLKKKNYHHIHLFLWQE